MRGGRALDSLNFFLADVRDGLGPYLAIYLLTVQQWDEASIGLTMSVAAIAGLVAQTPAGALVDASRSKRAIVVSATLLIVAASVVLPVWPSFWPVVLSQSLAGVAGAVFPPLIAAITLGMVGRRNFARRIGRNESFNHAGNAVAAAIAGMAAYVWGPVAVFVLMGAMALASLVSVLAIPADTIDDDLARGLDGRQAQGEASPSALSVLLGCKPLLVFAACAVLFHLANAAMLPLVGQKLALQNRNLGTSLMSLCIVAAQLVMVPVAMLVGATADRWGRKPLFAVGFLVLALRGALYPLSDNPYWLVGVQLLDGVGAGIFGALFPVIVADLMRGTGRFNVAQGAVATAQGVGAALSTGLAGVVVVGAGYSAAFLMLAAVAGAGLVLFWLAMPETAPRATTPTAAA